MALVRFKKLGGNSLDNVFPGFANIEHISNQIFDNYYVYINILYSVTIALLHSYNQWLNEKQCNDVIAVKEQWLMDRHACQLAGPD